jgi:hypothetical protein
MTSTRIIGQRLKHLAPAMATAMTALLSGCGGGGSSGSSPPPTPSPGTAILEWDAVGASNLAGYRIHYGTASGSYPQAIEAGTSTTYTLDNLGSGTRYYFVVTAVDTSGQESGYSNEVFKDIP